MKKLFPILMALLVSATSFAAISPITGPASVCAGSTIDLDNDTPDGTWSVASATVASVNATTGEVTGNTAGTAVITYTAPSTEFETYTVTVNPLSSAGTISGSSTICVGIQAAYSSTVADGTWTSGNPTTASISSEGIVTAGAAGTATISYAVSGTCGSGLATKVVTVATTGEVGPLTGNALICPGATTTLSNLNAGGTWTSGSPSIATVSTSGVVTGVASGSGFISYTTSAGCLTRRVVTVGALPLSIGGTASLCDNGTTTVICGTPGGVWSMAATGVASVNSSGLITGIGAGTVHVSYTVGSGCPRTQVITVNASPAAITGTQSMCLNATTTLSSTTSGGVWSSSNTGRASVGSATGVVSGATAGTCTITYTKRGCYRTAAVTVNALPNSISGVSTVCAGATTSLGNSTPGGTWGSSNGNATVGASTGVVSGVTAGNATISYIVTATGCYTSSVVTVNALPSAITGTNPICVSISAPLSSSPAGGTWASSTMSVATVGTGGALTGIAAGTSTISYTLSTGCRVTTVATVSAPPTLSGAAAICITGTLTLTPTQGGGTWTSGNGTVATVGTNGVVTGQAAGTANISYVVAGTCGSVYAVATVTVNPNTNPGTLSGATTLCPAATTLISKTVAGGVWSSSADGVATVGTGGVVTGVATGNVTISYAVTGTCGTAYALHTLTVNPAADAGTIMGATSVCTGATTTLTNAATGGVWSSSNTSVATVGTGGVVTGVAAGAVVISYGVSNGCSSVYATKSMTITTVPAAGTVSGASTVCIGATTVYTATATGGAWSSGSPLVASVASDGTVTGEGAGVAAISYSTTNGCGTSVAQRTVTVNTTIPAGTISGQAEVCTGGSVTYTSTVPGGVWSTSSMTLATIGTSGVLTGQSNGAVTVSYAVTNACGTTYAELPVTVSSSTDAGAISGVTSMCTGATTTLANGTSGGAWTSGTTSIATVGTGGVVSGVGEGTSYITYTLPTGCYTRVAVTVNSQPPAIGGTASVCEGLTTAVINGAAGGTWSMPVVTVASVSPTGIVAGISAGTAIISYSITPGCARTGVITVNASPAAITGTASVCLNATTTLSSVTTSGAWSSSNTGRVTVGASTGVVTGVSAGTATVTYTKSGCYVTATATVNMPPNSISGVGAVCEGSSITLTNSTPAGTWSSSNANATVGAATGVVTGAAAGNATISYTVTATGCYTTTQVTVNALPGAISGTNPICVSVSAPFSSSPSGGTWTSGTLTVANITTTGTLTGMAAGTSTISYMLSTGCLTTAVVTVAAPATLSGAAAICITGTLTLTPTQAGGAWTSGNGTVATVGTNGVVTGHAAGTANISYLVAGTCGTVYAVATVTVNPNTNPGTLSGVTTLCSGATSLISKTVAGGVWSSGDDGVVTVGTNGVITGVATGATTISYAVTGVCGTAYAQHAMTVNPTADPGTIMGTTSVCTGATTTLTNAVSGGTWSSGSSSIATVGTGGVVTGVAAGAVTVSYAVSNGCGLVYATKSMTITTVPAAGTVSGASTVCLGATTVYTATATSGAWSSGSPLVASVASDGTVTGEGAGVAAISYSVTNGCGTSVAQRSVTVNTTTSAGTVSGQSVVCTGGLATYTSTVPGGVWSTSDIGIATIGTSGTVTGQSAGAVTVSYAVTNTCGTTYSELPITVSASSDAGAITGTAAVCTGATTTLVNGTPGGAWSSGTTSVATVGTGGVVSGVAAGTSYITYSLPTGCYTRVAVTVNVQPLSIGGTLTVCEGATTTVINGTPAGTWSMPVVTVASVSPTGVVTGIASGTAVLSYAVTAGCARTAVITVNVSPSVIAGTPSMCFGAATTLSSTPSGGAWSSSNTGRVTVGTTGVVTSVTAGTAVVSYSKDGCYRTQTVTVNSLPNSISGSGIVCEGSSITYSNSTSGGTWSSSNANATINSSTGVLTGVTAGNSTISYIVTATRCYTTTQATINAIPASISVTGTNPLCIGGTSTLSSSPMGGEWTCSNLAIAGLSTAGVVTGMTAGTATVSYTVSTGCRSTLVVTVSAPPTLSGASVLCVGGTLTLTPTTAGGTWTSGAGTIATVGTDGTVTGVANGTAVISYQVAGTCVASYATAIVTVSPVTNPGTISGAASVCSGSTTAFTKTVAGGVWSSSDGTVASVGTDGTVTGGTAGTSIISYAVTNACGTAYATAIISVNPLPTPGTITGATTVCAGATTSLGNMTSGGVWSSSNTAVATVGTGGVVTGVASGAVNITYTVTNGCGTVYTTNAMTVGTVPTVAAVSGTTPMCSTGSAVFTNATGGGVWSSSNTSAATVAVDGTVSGAGAGVTNISYSVTNSCGTTVAQFTVTVNTAPDAGTITGQSTICTGGLSAYTSNIAGGVWGTSDIMAATVTSGGIVTGLVNGAVTLSYTVTDACGTGTATKALTVTSATDAGPITGTASMCAGATTTLANVNSGGTWTTSAGIIATVGTTGVVTGVAAGTCYITYSIPSGCFTRVVVTVNTQPVAIGGTGTVCEDLTTQLICLTPGGTWSMASAGVATISPTGVVTGIAAGTEVATYSLTAGCARTRIVTVNASPAAITGTPSVCLNSAVTLSSTTMSGTWTSANTGRATVVAATGVVTGVSVGTTTITYTKDGCYRTVTATVNALPNSIPGAGTVCEGATTTLTNSTAGGTWSSSNGFATVVAGTGVVTGVSSGVATISYITASGCYATKQMTVNVTPGSISGTNPICVGATSSFTASPGSGTWASGTLTVASQAPGGLLTANAAGTTTISYTLSTGCRATQVVTVNAQPAVISGTLVMCAGSTTTLTSATADQTWSSSTGAVATVGSTSSTTALVSGLTAGTSVISYTSGASCLRSVIVTVTAAVPAITSANSVCLGGTISATNATAGGTWSSSSTSIATVGLSSGVITSVGAGTTTITYRTSAQCFTTKVVTVGAAPSDPVTGSTGVCIGNTTTLSHATMGGTWTSSNVSRATIHSTTGVVTGVTAGAVTMTYYTAPGCYTTHAMTVNSAARGVGGAFAICEGSSSTLVCTHSDGTWASSDAGIASIVSGTGVMTGVSAGNATISYITNVTGCYITKAVTINARPAMIGGTASMCPAATTMLSTTPAGGTWATGAGIFATVNSSTGLVTGVNAGNANITYTLPTGCMRVQQVTVNPNPAVIGGATLIETTTQVTLTNATAGGTWGSSDPVVGTIDVNTGVFDGLAVGTTTITYQITATGCYRTRVQTVKLFGTRPAVNPSEGAGAVANAIRVYPTPTSGTVTVEASANGTFALYTIDGRKLEQYSVKAPLTTITLPASLAAGVYMCRYEGEDGTVTTMRIVLSN